MEMMKKPGIAILLCLITFQAIAQLSNMPLTRVEIRVDTLTFDSQKNLVTVNKEPRLYFKYRQEDQVCEVRLFGSDSSVLKSLHLVPSADFELLDSLVLIDHDFIQFRVRFVHLSASDYLNFTFNYQPKGKANPSTFYVPLLPYTDTNVELYTDDYQLFIGEEKAYELTSNHLQNIQVNDQWTTGLPVNYRLSDENGHLYLHLISTSLGNQEADIALHTIRPYIDSLGQLNYDLPVIKKTFTVKESRLRFLNTDVNEVILDSSNKDGYLIQLDNQPYFSLGHTYRIEDQEKPGGPLIAELFTVSYLNNGRILCRLRPYGLHRKSDGYLYLKDNDVARFILNINIIPKTVINKVSVLHEGGDWTSDLSVNPGENIQLKLEGQSLHTGEFSFEGLNKVSPDSSISNDNVEFFHLRIPYKISEKNIAIYHNQENTGFALNVKEYKRPRSFDYIMLDIDGDKKSLNDLNGVIMKPNVIHNMVISFDRNKIDSEGMLYGKQYLSIKITVHGKDNELVEIQNIDNVIVCPGPYSPRAMFYDNKNCTEGSIDITQYLDKKTYDLDEWSKITIEVSDNKDQYGGSGFTKKIDVILEKSWRFDIDVSFPAGLLTFGGGSSTNLTGISMAMIAQFSFYEMNRINRFKPYKVGVGFIALDAFNFSNSTTGTSDRDIAMVVLGSLYPTNKNSKLTFPLYFGAGYKLSKGQFFFLVGPGIRVNF